MTTPNSPSRLHQFNATYDALQDRVLLRLNTTDDQEFRFWVTRRYMKLLWLALGGIREAYAALRVPVTAQQPAQPGTTTEKRAGAAEFNTPYLVGHELPLGTAPALLSRIDVIPAAQGQPCLRLSPENSQGIDLSTNIELADALSRLLYQVALSADWVQALDPASLPGGQDTDSQLRRLH